MLNNTIRKNLLASFCFFALLLAAAVGVVDAQSGHPIDDDDIIASVPMGDHYWVSPLALKSELEHATGQSATVESMGDLLGRLPMATPSNGLRFEGALPSVPVQKYLGNLGYGTQSHIDTPAVAGASVAMRHSL